MTACSSRFSYLWRQIYIAGVIRAIIDQKFSREVSYKSLLRRVRVFAMGGMGYALDMHVIGNASVFWTVVIFFYLSNEWVSITKITAHLVLPSWIR